MGHRRIFLRALPALALALCLLLGLAGCGRGGTAAAADTAGAQAAEDAAGAELWVECFSAGKADAFLLYTADSAVLIDCGEKGFGKEILEFLEEREITALDCLIITHFDKDHVGGAAKVLHSLPVAQVLQSNCPKDSSAYEKYLGALEDTGLSPVTVRETLDFTLDGVSYTVDPPRRNSYDQDSSNNSSLIVTVRCGARTLLFTGDAQDARLAEFLSADPAPCDFLKVPYHGHWQERLPELIAALRPSCAVITSSDAEPEDAETLALLEEAGAEVFLTREGPVSLYCDGETLTASHGAAAEQAA